MNCLLDIARSKAATMSLLCVRGAQLPPSALSVLISSIPPLELNLGNGACVSNNVNEQLIGINYESAVKILKLNDCFSYALYWWTIFPAYMVELDLSGLKGVEMIDVQYMWTNFTTALQSLQKPIALQTISFADIKFVPSFAYVIEILLLSLYIRLISLDVTGK